MPFLSAPAQALQAPVAFTSAALPTYQTDGIAWSIAQAGGKVFVGGSFTSLRPPGAAAGTSEIARTNFAVLDAASGEPTSCAPAFTVPSNPALGTVRSLEVSPDGRTLYVGGFFSHVGATSKQHLVAIDIASCTLVSSFTPLPNGTVHTIAAAGSTVYYGGGFTAAGGQPRAKAAAAGAVGTSTPGRLLAWAPTFDKEVLALAPKPDTSVIAVGGRFSTVNGGGAHALVVVDPATGATVRSFPTGFIDPRSVVKDLVADETGFYTGNEGSGSGVFDGRLAMDWGSYQQRWRDSCLGATQAVEVYRGLLYSGSHAHDCSSNGAFPDGDRYHFLAQRVEDPTLLSWFPNTNDGLGESIGPRDMVVATTPAEDFLWSVGEFTAVNGRPQQGITRFGQGVDTAGPSLPTPSVTSFRAGEAQVAWRRSLDTDDSDLTYRVYRDNGTTPVHTVTAGSFFWSRRQLSFIDAGLPPGSTHSYRITASDGTTTTSTPWRSVTIASTTSAYAQRVRSDGATFLWRYDEPADVFLSDSAGTNDSGTLRGGAAYQVTPAAIAGDPSRAITLSGGPVTSYSEARYEGPKTYTAETWFKTTTTAGGKLIGFGDKQTYPSSSYDRQVYMANDGRLLFGVAASGGLVTLPSPGSYNDGRWHHLAATQGSAGMALYVDGVRVARNAETTSQNYNGYWRVGGDNLNGWPSAPTSPGFAGSMDETAVYPTALSAATIADHYRVAGGTAPTGPSDFYGQTVAADDPTLYWRLGEAVGPTAADVTTDGNTGTYSSGVTFGQAGAISGTTNKAVALSGTTTGLIASTNPIPGPSSYSTEVWVKTTSTQGGKLFGFGNARSGSSSNYDRHVYLRNDGRLVFGVWTGAATTITSASAYNDGDYHHVVATQGSGGMALWVDGVLVGSNAESGNQSYSGHWRVGGDNLAFWPTPPTSNYLAGTVDEVSVYPTALTSAQVVAHHNAGRGSGDQAPPTTPATVSASVTRGDVALTWQASTDDVGVTGYDVHRSATSGFTPSTSTLIASPTGTSFTDSAVPAGVWYYRVIAKDAAGGRSAPTDQVSVTVTDTRAPSAPTAPSATTTADSANVSWTASSDDVAVTEYDVYRSTTAGFTPATANKVTSTTATSVLDAPLSAGRYYYRLTARDAAGNVSAPSAEVTAVVGDDMPPSVPSGVTTTVTGSTVGVAWSASTDELQVSGYDVHRSSAVGALPSSGNRVGSVTGTSFSDANVPAGTWYYRVVAKDAAGNRSEGSTEVPATVDAQPTVVRLAPIADAYGNAGATSTNYGTSATLMSRGNVGATSYLRFTMPAAPAGKVLTSAALRVRVTTDRVAGSAEPHDVRLASDSWSESTLTWDNRPPVGADSVGTIPAGAVVGGVYTAPLDVAAMRGVLGRQSSLAVNNTGVDGMFFWSRDHPTASYRPELSLTFSNTSANGPADTSPPSTPATVTAAAAPSAATVRWAASSDNVGVSGYDVHRSSTRGAAPSTANQVGSVTGTIYSDTGVPAGTWHYRVVAKDAAGNRSGASAEGTATVAASPTVVRLTPTADTYGNASVPTKNYGSSSILVSRGDPGVASYLRFAVPSAPEGKALTSAVLRIRTSTETIAGSKEPHYVRLGSDSWVESTLTWDNRPSVGPAVVGTIPAGAVVDSAYDVTLDVAAIRGMVGRQASLAVDNTGVDWLSFWSRNHATASYRPQLTLTYQ